MLFQSLTDDWVCLLTVCRPVLNQYVHTAEEFHDYATELFEIVKQGHLKLALHGEYPLTTEGIKQSQIDISASSLLQSR